jgi:hypothetical protein
MDPTEAHVEELTYQDEIPPALPAQHRPLVTVGLAVLIALVAGMVGATLDHLAFPAHNGATGARGAVGVAGPRGTPGTKGATGPQGAPGQAANISAVLAAIPQFDTNKLGYCFNEEGTDTLGVYTITSVNFTAPEDNAGTLSCPIGTFISLTPMGPQGNPVTGYNPTDSSSGQ